MTKFELRPAKGSTGFTGTLTVINDLGSVTYDVDLQGDTQGVLVEERDDGFFSDAFELDRE